MSLLWWRLSALTGLCLVLAGCAQVGPPLPPSLELPKPPADLRAIRKGNSVTLRWTEPALTTDRQSVRYVGPTHVCRTTDEEMKDCGAPVGTVDAPSAASTAGKPALQTFTDTLPATLQEQNPAGEITYAVEVLNRDGRTAGLSNQVRVEAVPTFPAPTDVSAELNGDGVTLTWTGTGETKSDSQVQHRYRIYRLEEGSDNDLAVGEIPAEAVGPARFTDNTLAWEKTYQYRVVPFSIISQKGTEIQVEGDDSNRVRVVAHDIFPPAIPSGLQAVASGEGQKPFTDLIWAPVTTADLAGYNVYRRDGGGVMTKLNADLVKAPAYRDTAVSSGKTYVYSISSVDIRGNESAKSEEASEAVP
jgi:hypothetical protein